MRYTRFIFLPFLLFILVSCAEQDDPYIDRRVEELYNIAMDLFEDTKYQKAAKAFAEVERQHPYSNWALKAQIMSAYCYYEAKKYDEAVEAFNTFIQLHPSHAEVPYAYYMIGLCYYEQIPIVERDQKPCEKSLSHFSEVITRFPQSPYAKDSKFKIDLIRDHLAGKEMDVGRFYLKRGSYLAAVNRFKAVVDQYQTTSHVPESLHRLVECYVALGLIDQAQASAAVLGHNYPASDWYQDSYNLLNTQNKPDL
jgi:outer membrane protein assembly factor BamD